MHGDKWFKLLEINSYLKIIKILHVQAIKFLIKGEVMQIKI